MNKREFIYLARLIFKLKPLPKHGTMKDFYIEKMDLLF